jgi:hypothetical protein
MASGSMTSAMACTKAKLRRDCFIVPKGEVPSEVQGRGRLESFPWEDEICQRVQRGKQQKLKMFSCPHDPTTRMQDLHSVSRTEVYKLR